MKNKVLAKVVHLHLGCPALGGGQSVAASRNNILEVTPNGIVAISTKTKRAILLPYSNIVDVELYYQEETEE